MTDFQPRIRQRPRRRRAILVVAVLASLLLASTSDSHIREGPQRWYFSGVTFGKKDGKYKPSDPLNVVFWGGGPNAPIDVVREHVHEDFGMNSVCPSSTQWVYFTARDDWNTTPPYATYDEDDRQLSSYDPCGPKYHIRIWDDYEHWVHTWDHPTRDRWAVAGVHHERLCGKSEFPFFGHCPNRDWDIVERDFRDKMEEHCSYLRWKYHPGADRRLQGYDSDGRFVLIHMRHVDDPGPCPKPPLGG